MTLQRCTIVAPRGDGLRVGAAAICLPERRVRFRPAGPTSAARLRRLWHHAGVEHRVLSDCFARRDPGGPAREAPSAAGAWVRVAGEASAADMAAEAAARLDVDDLRNRPGTVIYHYGTVSEQPTWSTACRLQHALSLRRANAFGLAQGGLLTPFAALAVALAMLESEPDLEYALLVGSDKFVPPYGRMWDGLGPFSDGAGAVRLDRSDGGLRLVAASLGGVAPARRRGASAPAVRAAAAAAVALVTRTLQRVGTPACAVRVLLLPTAPALARRFQRSLEPVYGTLVADDVEPLLNGAVAVALADDRERGAGDEAGLLAIVRASADGRSLGCAVFARGPRPPSAEPAGGPAHPVWVEGAAYVLPRQIASLQRYATLTGRSRRWAERLRRGGAPAVVCTEPTGDCTALARAAVARVLRDAAPGERPVDFVVFHHTFHFPTVEPRSAVTHIGRAAGIAGAPGCSVAGLHCASSLAALRVGRDLVRSGAASRVLVVGADCFFRSARRAIRDVTVQSDGASAVLLTASHGRLDLLSVATLVDGRFYRGVTASAAESQALDRLLYLNCTRVARKALRRAGIALDDVRLVVTDNMNAGSWSRVLAALGVPASMVFSPNRDHAAHACSSDLIVNLSQLLEREALRPGEHALLLTVGLGAAWGAAVVRA